MFTIYVFHEQITYESYGLLLKVGAYRNSLAAITPPGMKRLVRNFIRHIILDLYFKTFKK